jgi:hypothetical protein
METGIDKLEITTKEWQVHRWENSGLTLRPSMQQAGQESEPDSFVLVDKFGTRKSGEKVLLNHPLFNLTINQYGMRLTTNPSKPYHPINLVSDDKTLHERVETVITVLHQEHGILFNLDGSKITRLDTAKNVELINPVHTYQPIFSTLRLPRSTHQAQYPDGFQTGNNSQTCIFYNKGQERKKDSPEIFDLYGNRLMRGERQLKGNGIHTHLGLKVFQDLKNFGIDHLKDKYSEWMAKQVFSVRTIGETQYISFDDSIKFMMRLKELHPSTWEKKYRRLFGVDEVIRLHGGIDNYLQLVGEVAQNRNTPNKVRKELLQELQLRAEIVESAFGYLYEELKRKFVA